MNYGLPETVSIQGHNYNINSDYRAILDICVALSDPDLDQEEKFICALAIFYPDFLHMPQEHLEDAVRECFRFINCGEDDTGKKSPRLVDWEQDFQYLCAPINRVCGKEIRAAEYMHWWTFISAYYEIGGDCTFAQIVRIRDKLARRKSLDKIEREFLRNNRKLVNFKQKYTAAEQEFLKEWGAK